jgi:hypothetical protein
MIGMPINIPVDALLRGREAEDILRQVARLLRYQIDEVATEVDKKVAALCKADELVATLRDRLTSLDKERP